MINKIIAFSIYNKFVIGLFTVALIGIGVYSMYTVNLGSVPDITNNQVQVMTVSQNLGTEDIEQFVTYPVELAMGNLPGVKEIRSVSRFGLSVVTIVFKDDMGIYLPRQLIQEKLNEVKQKIPDKFGNPFMGPITTGLGQIYQYTIELKENADTSYSITELRTIQDWIVKRQLTLVDGIVGVNSFGGMIKQYEIAINPERLNAMNVSISEVFRAMKRNNVNTGGAYIEKNNMANFIRGEGLIHSLEDIRKILVKKENGIPITIGDIAHKVQFGNQVRYGAFTKDGREAVGGIVMLLKGSNPNAVIENVKNRMEKIETSLPKGLKIVPFLDRSDLIERTTSTVTKNLAEGALIVIFVLVLLLGSLRGGLITASVIPLSLLFAFILMKQFNVWANLMSLGAIDFGIIVDGAVIIVEGTVHKIEQRFKGNSRAVTREEMDKMAYNASSEMMNSAFFGQLIILIVFAPILFLTGVEGKMFRPMAFTFGFAVIGAIILCLTYVPMMSALVMKPIQSENWYVKFESWIQNISDTIISGIYKPYASLLKGALKMKFLVIALALILLIGAGFTFSRMGGQFIPQLDEGDIAMQALIRPGSSLDQTIEISKKIENTLRKSFPEIKSVLGRIGVSDIPTDPMPMDIVDMFIILDKDKSEWTSASSKQALIKKIKDKLNSVLTGVNLVFTQPVELRFNELLTGVREDVAVKLYGEDLEVLASKAQEMSRIIKTIPGVGDVNAERISGLPQMTVDYNRDKLAQYGLDIKKLNMYISTAFAGGKAGVIFEGEKRFDLVVRYDEAHRKNINNLRNMYIDLKGGRQVPLKEVAEIKYKAGPMQISRDNTYRRTYVGVNTRGRDVESVVHDIQEKLDEKLSLPSGYYIDYGGEFENLQKAKERLSIVVPIALFLIFILLYFALSSFPQAIMIYMAIPFAVIGGIFMLAIRGMPFSISAGVGFVVLFGVAVLNGLVLISRFNSLKKESDMDLKERILIGTKERMRPILLTATAAIMGFTPMAFSTSAGAEVQRPLATVVIGGLITATFLTLVVLPVLYGLLEKNRNNSTSSGITTAVILLIGSFGGAFFPSASANAQVLEKGNTSPISIEQAQSKAMEFYPAIKAGVLNIKSEKALKNKAWDLGSTYIYTGKEEVGNGTDGIYTKIGVKQEGIDVFGIAPKLRLHNERILLAEKAVDLTTTELKREICLAWNNAYIAQKKYHIYARIDSLFGEIKDASKIRKDAEAISGLEYLATSNEANKSKLRMKQALRDYNSAIQKFNLWLPDDSLYTVQDVQLTDIQPLLVDYSDTIKHHPQFKILRKQMDVATAKIKERKSDYLPELQGKYALQNVRGNSGFYSFEVGISVPLVFAPIQAQVKSAKINREIASKELMQEKIELNSAYRSKKEQYLKWYESWQYYSDTILPIAQKQRKGAVTTYNEGAIDYTTFLQNIREAIETEIEAMNVLVKYLNSRAKLNYYLNAQ